MAWHDGRTFYCCPCGYRDERLGEVPATLPCDGCKGVMRQWVPPAVAADRARTSVTASTGDQFSMFSGE